MSQMKGEGLVFGGRGPDVSPDLTHRVIGLAMQVHSDLGPGFLEKVYERALAIQFQRAGLAFVAQAPLKVTYHGEVIGDYIADFLVEGCLLLELKAVAKLPSSAVPQLRNYLRCTGYQVGLLLNFGQDRLNINREVNSYTESPNAD